MTRNTGGTRMARIGMTSLARRMAVALIVVAGFGRSFAACQLGNIADLPVTLVDMHPIVVVQINGTDARFVVDSGAFYTSISPASAAEFNLKTSPAPYNLHVMGIGGEASVSVASVKVFTLAGVPLHNREFLVGGGEVGGGAVGLLGQNILSIGDVEYDLAKGLIRLMSEHDCGKTNLAYWASGEARDYSVMPIKSTSPLSPQTTGDAFVNGVKLRVMFDSGASNSFLTKKAAERAGIKVDSPGVVFAGYSRGIGREQVNSWIAKVASFKIGDEEIRNTRLRIGDSLLNDNDMLLGADFFLSHRLYVANKQHLLFFTYNGGPVFNLASTASTVSTPKPDAPQQVGDATGDDAQTPGAAAGPTDAAQFSRRGTAYAARRDFANAIADLKRACELAPQEPDYFYELGIAEWENKSAVPALADFDQAIVLKPDHVPALVARAELRLQQNEVPAATQDLNAADRAASKEADARFRMAWAYARADLVAPEIAQLDLWIAAHDADARLVNAKNERCWARAANGLELSKALDDCNAALRLSDKKGPMAARILNSRGLVRLRLGDYDKSIADYDASLNLQPKDAWALYGRGTDKVRRGRTAEGQADRAAAMAVWPAVEQAFTKRGIAP